MLYLSLQQIAEAAMYKKQIDKIVSDYIKTNDKKLIPSILKIINNDEDLKKLNDQLKHSVTVVYRGIALDDKDLTIEDIIDYDKKQKYVATSRSEQIAKEYAKGRGQLNGKKSSKPEKGCVLTYEVTSDDIVFDLSTFDKEYGTIETIITPKTATIIKAEEVLQDDE